MGDITVNVNGTAYRAGTFMTVGSGAVASLQPHVFTSVNLKGEKNILWREDVLLVTSTTDAKFKYSHVFPFYTQLDSGQVLEEKEDDASKINDFEREQYDRLQLMIDHAKTEDQRKELLKLQSLSDWYAKGKHFQDINTVIVKSKMGDLHLTLTPMEREDIYEKGSIKILISKPAQACDKNGKSMLDEIAMVQITGGKDAFFFKNNNDSGSLGHESVPSYKDDWLQGQFIGFSDELAYFFENYIGDPLFKVSKKVLPGLKEGPRMKHQREKVQVSEDWTLLPNSDVNAVERLGIYLLTRMVASTDSLYQKQHLSKQLEYLKALAKNEKVKR